MEVQLQAILPLTRGEAIFQKAPKQCVKVTNSRKQILGNLAPNRWWCLNTKDKEDPVTATKNN